MAAQDYLDNPKPASELPDEFQEKLISDSLFSNLDTWSFQKIRGGGVSPYTYRLFSAERDFFVKEVTYNEKYTLQLFHKAVLKIAPIVHSTLLLDKGILVTDTILEYEYPPFRHLLEFS
jgi:hypothetical protein